MKTYRADFHIGGDVRGEAIVSRLPLSFLGGVNSETGMIIDSHNPLCGSSMAGKILIYPFSKGSTGDCMRLWRTCFNGKGPIAIINTTPDPIHVEGALRADLPLVFGLEANPTVVFQTGDILEIHGNTVELVVRAKEAPFKQHPTEE